MPMLDPFSIITPADSTEGLKPGDYIIVDGKRYRVLNVFKGAIIIDGVIKDTKVALAIAEGRFTVERGEGDEP